MAATEPDILVNFDVAPTNAGFVAHSVNGIRGGRWKDRFRAKKQLQYKQKKAGRDVEGIDSDGINNGHNYGLQGSNVRDGVDFQHDAENHSLKRKRGSDTVRSSVKGDDHQVISSIFSSNPEAAVKPTQEKKSELDSLPTNAPLQDGSAFATMGLMPTLTSHLINKLNLKNPTSIQQVAIPQLISSDSDAFIQAETGSGKTLTYLLPVVQRILAASSDGGKLQRSSGCFAIILAPTRELGRQIHSVLAQLLSHPSLHWLVPILLLGGEKKKSEKARIRKGGNILVATPGRLADHLVNTTSLDVGSVRWLVLDEGDRLMELGFEETLQQILDALNSKQHQPSIQTMPDTLQLPAQRITILCSATMKSSVQRLGDMSLKDALYLKNEKREDNSAESQATDDQDHFQAPAQLKQAYIVSPAKLRLVSLASILRRAFVRKKENMKVIVFFSCADSVDFHYEVFSRSEENADIGSTKADFIPDNASPDDLAKDDDETQHKAVAKPELKKRPNQHAAKARAPTIDPAISLFKLHGSLAQQIRTATLNAFFHEKEAAVLFCTDVASRGLDLPNVDLVVQYDPPFSKEDYIHRIGRTARAGRDGRAMIFLLPGCEEGYPAQVLKDNSLTRTLANEVLKKGFGEITSSANDVKRKSKAVDQAWKKDFMPKTSGAKWEQDAIEFHLNIERWVLSSKEKTDIARRAFQSHVRAYATHVAAERGVFDIKSLHLGHLAKSFGLRERPGDMKVPSRGKNVVSRDAKQADGEDGRANKVRRVVLDEEDELKAETEAAEREESSRRMRRKVKEHMNAASEFNIG